LASLFAGEVPVVLFNRGLPRARASQVVLNNKRGAEQATRHLADIGCKRLLHLAGPAYADNARARAQGFIRAAREAGYQDTDVDVVEIGFHPVTTNRVLDRLIRDVLSNIVPQTGVLAVYDVLAVRTMEIARYDLGLRIPDDIAIVGFDDTYLVSNRFIHLTTVSHHPYEMGAQAARLLVNRIEGRPGKWPQRVVLEPRLVSRGSTVADPDLWDERPHSARSSTASRA
jgi:DNA-binding LacI/PurR family transcriptional regulator